MTLNHLRIVKQVSPVIVFIQTNVEYYSDQFTNMLSIEFTMHVYVCTLSNRLKTTYSFLYFLFINCYFMFTVMVEHIILCYVFLTYKYYSLKVEYTIWILYCKGNVYKMIRKNGFISYRIFIHKAQDISLMLHTRVWFLGGTLQSLQFHIDRKSQIAIISDQILA